MAKGLDELLQFLVNQVALDGERGAAPADVSRYAAHYYTKGESVPVGLEDSSLKFPDTPFLHQIWTWLSSHPEISTKSKNEVVDALNADSTILRHTRLSAIVSDHQDDALSNLPSSTPGNEVRLFASEERQWYALAGHGPDLRRITALEFSCLSIIGSNRDAGIAQPLLVRLTGQDKRSLPERTSRLAEKGYIAKRKVLWKGCATSLCTLQQFATEDLPSNSQVQHYEGSWVLHRFSEYESIIRDALEIIESKKLIIWMDMRLLLDIPIGSITCKRILEALRRFEFLGCLERVQTVDKTSEQAHVRISGYKSFQFVRSVTSQDWDTFYMMGRDAPTWNTAILQPEVTDRARPEANHSEFTLFEGEEEEEEEEEQVDPIWTPDRPLANTCFDALIQAGPEGLITADACKLATGLFFRRSTSNILQEASDTWFANRPLGLAIVRDAAQFGKKTVYRYYTSNAFQAIVDRGLSIWQSVDRPQPDINQLEDTRSFPEIPGEAFHGQSGLSTLADAVRAVPGASECRRDQGVFSSLKDGSSSAAFFLNINTQAPPQVRPNLFHNRGSRVRKYSSVYTEADLQAMPPAKRKRAWNSIQVGRRYHAKRLEEQIQQQVADGASWLEAADALLLEVETLAQMYGTETFCIKDSVLTQLVRQHRDNLYLPSRAAHTKRLIVKSEPEEPQHRHKRPRNGNSQKTSSAEATNLVIEPRRSSRSSTKPPPQDENTEESQTQEEVGRPVRLRSGRQSRPTAKFLDLDTPSSDAYHLQTIQRPFPNLRVSTSRMTYEEQYAALAVTSTGLHVGKTARLKTSARSQGPLSLLMVIKTPKLKQHAQSSNALGLDSQSTAEHSIAIANAQDHDQDGITEPFLAENTNLDLPVTPQHGAQADTVSRSGAVDSTEEHSNQGSTRTRKRKRSTTNITTPKRRSARRPTASALAIAESKNLVGAAEPANNESLIEPDVSSSDTPDQLSPTRVSLDGYNNRSPLGRAVRFSGRVEANVAEAGWQSTKSPTAASSLAPLRDDTTPRSSLLGATEASAPSPRPKKRVRIAEAGKILRHGGSVTALKEKIVLDILERCGGVFPGDREIWYPFAAEWMRQSGGSKPDVRTVNTVIARLETDGKLRKIGFNFQTQTGKIKIKHMLLLPGVSENEVKVESMRQKIIENHTKLYIPDELGVAEEIKHHPDAWWASDHQVSKRPIKYVEQSEPAMSRQISNDIKSVEAPTPTERLRIWQNNIVARKELQNVLEEKARQEDARDTQQLQESGSQPAFAISNGTRDSDTAAQAAPESSKILHGSKVDREQAMPPKRRKENVIQSTTNGELQNVARQRRIDTIARLNSIFESSMTQQHRGAKVAIPRLPPRRSVPDASPRLVTEVSTTTALGHSLANSAQPSQTRSARSWQSVQRLSRNDVHDYNGSPNNGLAITIEEFRGPKAGHRPYLDKPDPSVDIEQRFFSSSGCFGTFLEVPSWFVPASLDHLLTRTATEISHVRSRRHHSMDSEFAYLMNKIQKWEQADACARNVVTDKFPFINIYPFDHTDPFSTASIKPRRVDRLQQAFSARKRKYSVDGLADVPQKRQRLTRNRGRGPEDDRSIMIACVVAKGLFQSGHESYTDWDVVCRLISHRFTLAEIRRRWITLRPSWRFWLKEVTLAFEEKFLVDYEKGMIPEIDYQDLDATDWEGLMAWAEEAFKPLDPMRPAPFSSTSKLSELPASRALLERKFSLLEKPASLSDPFDIRRKETIHSNKRKWTHQSPLAVMENQTQKQSDGFSVDDRAIARSWVKANSLTPSEEYSSSDAYQKLSSVPSLNLELAAKQLVDNKILTTHHRGPGRLHDVSERFLNNLKVNLDLEHFAQAKQCKLALNRDFETNMSTKFDYHAQEGASLAVINLMAAGALNLSAVGIQADAMGALQGSYRSRSSSSDHFAFEVWVTPTARYARNSHLESIPAKPRAERCTDETGVDKTPIPAWLTIHDTEIEATWLLAISSILSILAVRPGLTCDGLVEYVAPSLESWEVWLIMEWAVIANIATWVDDSKTGILLKSNWWTILS